MKFNFPVIALSKKKKKKTEAEFTFNFSIKIDMFPASTFFEIITWSQCIYQ